MVANETDRSSLQVRLQRRGAPGDATDRPSADGWILLFNALDESAWTTGCTARRGLLREDVLDVTAVDARAPSGHFHLPRRRLGILHVVRGFRRHTGSRRFAVRFRVLHVVERSRRVDLEGPFGEVGHVGLRIEGGVMPTVLNRVHIFMTVVRGRMNRRTAGTKKQRKKGIRLQLPCAESIKALPQHATCGWLRIGGRNRGAAPTSLLPPNRGRLGADLYLSPVHQ